MSYVVAPGGDSCVNQPEPDPKLLDITIDVSEESRVNKPEPDAKLSDITNEVEDSTNYVEEFTNDVEEEDVCNNKDPDYTSYPIDLTEDKDLSPAVENAAMYPCTTLVIYW